MFANFNWPIRFWTTILGCSVWGACLAQTPKPVASLTVSGYMDAYYAYYTDSLPPNSLQAFTTVSPRSNRIGLNVAQLSLAYAAEKLRSTLTLHAGDIAQATWSEDFPLLQEAHVGVLLSKSLWFDAGFFHTHIGTESFLPKNDMLSSTAVATYNEPFYQSGARLSYAPVEKLNAQLWLLNGYNRFLDNNNAKSIGLLLSYKFKDNLSISYSSLFGKESDEGVRPKQFRSYHNVYLSSNWKKKLFLIVGADVGNQTNSSLLKNNEAALMYNGLLTSRYQFTSAFSATIRAEYFNDPEGFISGVLQEPDGSLRGLQLWGITAGVEYIPAEGAYLRMETRHLQAENHIFHSAGALTGKRTEVQLTFGIAYDKVFSWQESPAIQ